MRREQLHYDGGAIFGAKGNHYTKDGHCYLMEWDDEACESVIVWCYLDDDDFIEAMMWAYDDRSWSKKQNC